MSSLSSSNENAGDSRTSYYATQQQAHLQYQIHQQQLHLQQQIQQQQQQSLNYNNSASSRYQNHYQHQPLTNIFPSIYSDANNYMSQAQLGLMSGQSQSTPISSGYSSVQRQIQQDWNNREYIAVILSNIKKLTDFLNTFELSCRSKLATLDEKLTKLEKQIDFVEAKVTKGETLN